MGLMTVRRSSEPSAQIILQNYIFFFNFLYVQRGDDGGGGVKYQNFPNSVNNPYKPFYEYFLCIHVLSAQCTFECSILDIFKNMLKKKGGFIEFYPQREIQQNIIFVV